MNIEDRSFQAKAKADTRTTTFIHKAGLHGDFMRLNGWGRLMVVLSVAWIAFIGAVAYLEYPKTLKDRPVYWVSYKAPPDATGTLPESVQRIPTGLFDDVISPARVDPNWKTLLGHGTVPVVLLWALYGSVVWIRRGFDERASP